MLSEFTMKYALSLLGTLYLWGGQSPRGVDCSGFVILVLQAEGLWPRGKDSNAQGIYNQLLEYGIKDSTEIGAGCIAFYGSSKQDITHVAICVNDHQVIEAGGGNRSTTSEARAIEQQAHVRISPLYGRKDLVALLDIP